MRFPVSSRAARVFVAACLVAASGFAARTTDVFADAVDDSIKAMQDAESAGDESKCVAKLESLKDSADPRVAAAERELLKSKSEKVACAAVRILSARKDDKCLEWLKGRLADREIEKDKTARPELLKSVLDALAVYRDPGALKPLEDVVKTFLQTDGEFARRAIAAYGSVPQRSVVDQLLFWLGTLETSHGGKSSGGAGGKSKYMPDVAKARDASRDALFKTLVALTDQDPGDYAAWKKWWSEHGKTFEFPKGDSKDRGINLATLPEWTDQRYGYTLKRPTTKGWAFLQEPGFRIALARTDDSGTRTTFVGWNYYDIAGSSFKDVKDYVAWWMFQQLPEHEFAKYASGGEPTQTPKKFAGRDWVVIGAKGATKDALSTWGEAEHRIYVTKLSERFIYAWAIVRTTAAEEDKQATWDSVEGVLFAPK
jgi:hypothetical protein